MNNRRKKLTIGAAVVAAAAVAVGAGIAVASGGGTQTSKADVASFAEPEARFGQSTLRRQSDSIKATLQTTDAGSRHANTMWWVVFNQPENCLAPGCNEEDIFVNGDPMQGVNEAQIAATDLVASYADGGVSTPSGNQTFQASIAEGEIGHDTILGEGATLKDAKGAEVHLVVRSHGPVIDELVDEQTSSFAGGCEVDLLPPDRPVNVGECGDIQFAVHQP